VVGSMEPMNQKLTTENLNNKIHNYVNQIIYFRLLLNIKIRLNNI